MKRYYCRPLKKYVTFIIKDTPNFDVIMFAHTTGVFLFFVTMPYKSSYKDCGFVNTKEYPWLADWLTEKDVAVATGRHYLYGGFNYPEFRFKKEG